jgi:hypothetical protein
MVLTPEQQAELDSLTAQAALPEPRTETGVTGVLHALIDSASGAVAHRGAEAWAALHTQAEGTAEREAAEPDPSPSDPASPPAAAAGGTEGYGFGG